MPDTREESGLDQASHVAHTVHGAVKAGKAIAAAAKGASAAGPYGAVAGALWESRRHAGKIAVIVVVLLLLPVLFILLLPSLIFGGLTSSGSDPGGQPILNDNAAIIESSNEIAFTITQVLGEGIDDVKEQIAQDFAETGGDQYEVINPYAESILSNTNAIVGQYCAFRDQDWERIALADLEQTLRDGMEHLYTFTRTSTTRSIPDDPDTEDDESGTEVWYYYTIVYQGEAYLADHVFHLSAQQKELADDYAQNLSVFLGDGMFQYAGSSNSIPSLGDIRFTDGATEVRSDEPVRKKLTLYAKKEEKSSMCRWHTCWPLKIP